MEEPKSIKAYIGLSVVILLLGCVHMTTSTARKGPLTNDERWRFLLAHNNFRRDSSMEFQGTTQPPAGNMKRLYWNAALEADALAWTEHETIGQHLHHGHSKVHSLKEYLDILKVQRNPDVGQNIAVGSESPKRIVENWYAQTSQYIFENNMCSSKGICDHYTQTMWADSKYVGCAINKRTRTEAFVTCNYYPGGNLKGMRPYKQGENCSFCNTFSKDGFTECDSGLCQPKDKCSPVKECKVVDFVNCLCSEADYNGLVMKLVGSYGLRLAPSSLLLLISVVVGLLIHPLDIA